MTQPPPELYDLLHHCTVKLTLADGTCGTGFFVAPGYVLTCEHVVRTAGDKPIAMRWQSDDNFAQAYVERSLPDYDLALLRFEPPRDDLPCVALDREIAHGDKLYLYGYPAREYLDARPEDFVYVGDFREGLLPLILLKEGQMQGGMSGAALLNTRTGKVCAMAKFTRDEHTDLGGGGIKVSVILDQFRELRDWQRDFHQQDKRWQDLLKVTSKNSQSGLTMRS